jgi:hypothetical protein
MEEAVHGINGELSAEQLVAKAALMYQVNVSF